MSPLHESTDLPTRSITRRRFVAMAGGALLASVACVDPLAPFLGRRPNIIYVMVDDLGWGDLASYGNARIRTPHLDRLAARGTRFTRAYAIAPVCTPTRVGLMTGLHPARSPVGIIGPLFPKRDDDLGLLPETSRLASELSRVGYRCGLFGKWHLGIRPRFRPERHGFHESFGPLGGSVDHFSHLNQRSVHDLYDNGEEVFRDGYLTDLITDRAIEFVRSAPRPFFMSLPYTAPHQPLQGPDGAPCPDLSVWNTCGGDTEFLAMVERLDLSWGRIADTLVSGGIERDTLVVFTSDNGGTQWSNRGGLRGQKRDLLEGGIRVPAIVSWPGTFPAGLETSEVITTLDWTATFLEAAGADTGFPLDGMSLLDALANGRALPSRDVFWRTFLPEEQRAARYDRWKYLWANGSEYLFDMEGGEEAEDLSAAQPATVAEMRARFDAWNADMLGRGG